MTSIGTFRDLEVWQVGLELVDAVFAASGAMPPREYDLNRQMRRAAVSIPSNIAEGYRRKGRRGAYQNHVSIAMGSAAELETQLEIAFRNGLLNRDGCTTLTTLLARTGAMLYRLHESLY